MPAFSVTKVYPHSLGLSCCFRQWQAESHCHHLHGYALQVELTFEADSLTPEGWVIDFGGLKPIKNWLEAMFDHRLLIADDDPEKEALLHLGELGIASTIVLPKVGCEAFALYIFDHVTLWLDEATSHRVRLVKVTVKEHEANAVTCVPI